MFVYVITASEFCQKIGISADPVGRLLQLRTGHYQELKLSHYAETPNAAWAEKMLHEFLKPYRIRGEWFSITAPQAINVVNQAVRYSVGHEFRPFAVGERILCVDEEDGHEGVEKPTVGQVYTVEAVHNGQEKSLSGDPLCGIDLVELPSDIAVRDTYVFRHLSEIEVALDCAF